MNRPPKRDPTRLVLATWWIVSILVYNVFSGNLLAFLSIRKVERPMDTIQELEQSGIKMAAFKGTSFIDFLKNSTDSRQRNLWSRNLRYNLFSSTKGTAYLSWVNSEGGAFFGERFFLTMNSLDFSEKSDGICDYHVASESVFRSLWCIGLPLDSLLLEQLSSGIERLDYMGLIGLWYKQALYPKNSEPCRFLTSQFNVDKLRPLTLYDLQMAFYILGSGLLIGVLVYVFEILLHLYKNKCYRRQINRSYPAAKSMAQIQIH